MMLRSEDRGKCSLSQEHQSSAESSVVRARRLTEARVAPFLRAMEQRDELQGRVQRSQPRSGKATAASHRPFGREGLELPSRFREDAIRISAHAALRRSVASDLKPDRGLTPRVMQW